MHLARWLGSELGLPIPSFAGPIEEAKAFVRRARCSLCGARRPCFQLGSGASIIDSRGAAVGVEVDGLLVCTPCLRGDGGLVITLRASGGLRMRTASPLDPVKLQERGRKWRRDPRGRGGGRASRCHA